jgi:hypothetical protein
VRATGYADRRARLSVSDQERQLQIRETTPGCDDGVKTDKVIFSSQPAGRRVFKFHLEPFSDEIILENNGRTILARGVDEQPQILYVEGEPRWEYAFQRRADPPGQKSPPGVTLLRRGVEPASTLGKG